MGETQGPLSERSLTNSQTVSCQGDLSAWYSPGLLTSEGRPHPWSSWRLEPPSAIHEGSAGRSPLPKILSIRPPFSFFFRGVWGSELSNANESNTNAGTWPTRINAK